MQSKVCCFCKEALPKTEEFFAWKNKEKGWFQSQCRPCQSTYRKEHYNRNLDKYKSKAKQWRNVNRDEIRAIIYSHLQFHPCVDCGETELILLEFDHVRGKKSFNISDGFHRTASSVRKEIDKCDIRCVVCHRRKTAKDFGWWLLAVMV